MRRRRSLQGLLVLPQGPPCVGRHVRRCAEGESPADATEAELAKIWCHVLGVARVSREASFFSLGGDSLLATALLAHIEKTFGRRLQPETLYAAKTVAALARVLVTETLASAEVTTFHGLAGDVACESMGEHSLVATDLLKALPAAFQRIRDSALGATVEIRG